MLRKKSNGLPEAYKNVIIHNGAAHEEAKRKAKAEKLGSPASDVPGAS